MSKYFDGRETRSMDERVQAIGLQLPELLSIAKSKAQGYRQLLTEVEPNDIRGVEDLVSIPILRKSNLAQLQKISMPFGKLTTVPAHGVEQIFQSPGPIYEPGFTRLDWWRIGRFLHACGIRSGDIVQNCFSYHLTPAGHIFENGIRAINATTVPAGTGNTELQVRAASDIGVTAYAGTPDYLKVILDHADQSGVDLSAIKRAAVGGGPLFPSLRKEYHNRGIVCLQNYATAEAGNIAYETIADEPMIIDEDVLVEIVTPGTQNPVKMGEIGEVVITVMNRDYPLIRFATGDLSAIVGGQSSCGRTNLRILGWRGRADQTVKVKGMFVHPEHVADFVSSFNGIKKARFVITRSDEMDQIKVLVEVVNGSLDAYASALQKITRLRGTVEIVRIGSLPNDGKVIDDQRSYE